MHPPTEHTLRSWDGTELFYRAWLPPTPPTRSAILFHRGHEHSGRWQETVEALNLQHCAVYAWDQRGHGRSAGARGFAPDVATILKDADAFTRHLTTHHGLRLNDTAVIAHSVGAVIAAAWVHLYAPPIRAMVLATPALRVKLYIPLALPALRLKQSILGPGTVKSYVKPGMITSDPAQAAAYAADPQVFGGIATTVLIDMFDTSTRLLRDAGAITTPTLLFAAGNDWVVDNKAITSFYKSLGSTVKQLDVLPGFKHAVFHEKERKQVTDRTRAFIDDCFARPPAAPNLVDADRGGHTRTEYDALRAPSRSPHWRLTKAFLKTVGKLSRGVDLGWKTGFDSGVTLDYVYKNKPQGTTPLGKLIDRNYLSSVGWRGIRIRGDNLQRSIRAAIERTHAEGKPVRLLDIAAGAGRYALQAMRDTPGISSTALLRDYKTVNVEAARALAAQLGLNDRVTVEQGDAFDRASLEAIRPRPTIAIVSGLYELFPENDGVRRSLAALGQLIEPGGTLLYTCQPYHPQMEFIARVLDNREGHPWIMRRRTQAEMDALVQEVGFEKTAQEIDPWGIFTVCTARRVQRPEDRG